MLRTEVQRNEKGKVNEVRMATCLWSDADTGSGDHVCLGLMAAGCFLAADVQYNFG